MCGRANAEALLEDFINLPNCHARHGLNLLQSMIAGYARTGDSPHFRGWVPIASRM